MVAAASGARTRLDEVGAGVILSADARQIPPDIDTGRNRTADRSHTGRTPMTTNGIRRSVRAWPYAIVVSSARGRRSPAGCRGRHQEEQQQRNQHQPVEGDIADDGRDQGPGVRGEAAEFRREIVVVLAQVLDRDRARRAREAARRERNRGTTFSMPLSARGPGGQPASDVAAAGNGREVIELARAGRARRGSGWRRGRTSRCECRRPKYRAR